MRILTNGLLFCACMRLSVGRKFGFGLTRSEANSTLKRSVHWNHYGVFKYMTFVECVLPSSPWSAKKPSRLSRYLQYPRSTKQNPSTEPSWACYEKYTSSTRGQITHTVRSCSPTCQKENVLLACVNCSFSVVSTLLCLDETTTDKSCKNATSIPTF